MRILIAGLAVFAFAKLVSRAMRPDLSSAQKVGLGLLIAATGAIVASMWGRARRHSWS